MGCFRSVYEVPDNSQLPNNSKLSEFSGDVIKFPINGVPQSEKANQLETLFYDRVPLNLKQNFATVKKYDSEYGYIIMENLGNEVPNSVPRELKDSIRDLAEPALLTQSDLDLENNNFRYSNGTYVLIDFPFRMK